MNNPNEAKSMSELVTPGQLANIRATSNSQRIDAEKACQALYGCKPEELNRKVASGFIDWLKAQPRFPHARYVLSLCPVCRFIQMRDGESLRCSNEHVFPLIHFPANIEEKAVANA